MWLMRRHDPQVREDGFGILLPHAAKHVDELMAAFIEERDDHGLRCWLLELIGHAKSPKAEIGRASCRERVSCCV